MESPWVRRLTIALLCALAFAPSAVHARICLVTLGTIERSECCSPENCCTAVATEAGPALSPGEGECRCCVDLDFGSADLALAAGTTSSAPVLVADPAPAADPFAALFRSERRHSSDSHSSTPVPRRPAAPLPLRI